MKQLDRDEAQNVEDAALFDRFASAIFAYLYGQIASRQDAEDLLLDVFLAAQQNDALSALGEERQLAWLRRVARNKVIDLYRHSALLTMLPLDEAIEREDEALTPEQHAVRRESYERLYHTIEQLAPEQRLLVRLRYGDGLRLVEIAAIMEKPQATLRKALARTLSQIRKLYERTEREHQP
jgi:RNA polymerase sigma-70 factor (ECF subfamily)